MLCLAMLVAAVCLPVPPASAASHPPDTADAFPPTGEIMYPLPGSWESYLYVFIQVRFTDPDGIMFSSLSMTIDGIPLAVSWNGNTLSASYYVDAEGLHAIEARASDQLGNGPTVLSWTFSSDQSEPVVNITTPSGNPELTDGSVVLAWTGTDTGSGIDHYRVRLDDDPWFDVGDATTFPFPELPPGVHYFQVEAMDAAGNYAYTSAVATVPFPPPQSPGNTTIVVNLPSEVPSWAVALIAINVVELAAIVALTFRRRRESQGGNRPDG